MRFVCDIRVVYLFLREKCLRFLRVSGIIYICGKFLKRGIGMETRKTDRRVVKTKKAIRRALMEALQDKELDKVTMKEIAERADVDRKTVYNYYADAYAVLGEIEDEAVAELESMSKDLQYDPENPLVIFETLTELLHRNFEVYSYLMRMENNSRLILKMIGYLRVKVRETISRSPEINQDRIELATDFVTAGLFSAYRYWFNAEQKCSLEEFSKQVAALVLEGVSVALRK